MVSGRVLSIIAEATVFRRRTRVGMLIVATAHAAGGKMFCNRIAGRSRKAITACVLAISGAISLTGAAWGPPQAETVTVYHGATLIDGTGAAPRPGMSVVVQGSHIAGVMPDAEAPEGIRIDMAGLHVLPGLIDAHVHLATPPDAARARRLLRRQLYSGVTAVRSMADDVRSVAELSRQAATGEIPAPDIVYAALMAGPGFFDDPRTIAVTRGGVPGQTPWMQAIDTDTDLVQAVAIARGTGAAGIKVYADLPADTLARIVAEAHRQGVPVWAHAAVFPALPMDGVQAGVDVVSHSCPMAYQASARPPNDYAEWTAVEENAFADGVPLILTELLARMAEQGTVLDATVRVHVEHATRYAQDSSGRPPRCSAELTYLLTREAYLQGVPIAAGTDGETAPEADFPALHEELEMLAGPVGMAPMDVLVSATRNAARALGHEQEMGTVEVGKRANLVFVHGDPLERVHNLRNVVLTVKAGRSYPRADFIQTAEES